MALVWVALGAVMALLPSASHACTDGPVRPVALEGGMVEDIGCAMHLMRLPRGAPDLAAARADFDTGAFAALNQTALAFGLEQEAFWITLELHNTLPRAQSVMLDLGLPFIARLEMWGARAEGAPEMLLRDGADLPFGQRAVANRMIVSPPLDLQPGESVRIWAYAAFDGPARLPLSVYPVDQLGAVTLARDVPIMIFVSVAGTLLLVLVALGSVLRSRTGLMHAGFFAGLLAYTAQLSGLNFAYLWPGWPEWNAVASHPIGLFAVIFALLFAGAFIQAGQRRPILSWTIRGLIALSLAFVLAPLVLPLIPVKSTAGLVILAFLCVQLWAAIAAMLDKVPGRGFYLAGTLVLFGYLGLFTLSSQIELLFGPAASASILHVGQLLDGTIFCLAALRQTWELREREMVFRAHGARIAKELASTRHDLRQPLLSMRATLDDILTAEHTQDAASRDKLAAGLSYIEGIIDGSAELTPAPETDIDSPADARSETALPLDPLLRNLALMFDNEAQQKNMQIRVVKTGAVVMANGLDLFRVLSNLVSNAVQHSQSDTVLIGVRRVRGGLAIDVVDRGIGLAASEVAARAQGTGLGLGIVAALCAQNGWTYSTQANTDAAAPAGCHARISGLRPAGRTRLGAPAVPA